MLTLTTLASGSSGNCALASDGSTHILIDAGISARRICTNLRELGLEPSALSGILITHEHSDHIAGLATLTKQQALPIYAPPAVGREICRRIPKAADVIHTITPGRTFAIGGLDIASFATPHDTVESVGYRVSAQGRSLALATDLGHVTPAVREGIRGAHLLVVETNHDVEWVQSGDYPYFLKERILGRCGHLSNEDGAALALDCVAQGTQTVLLAHLSSENNTPARAYDTVAAAMERAGVTHITLAVAPRSERGITYNV